MSKQKIKAQIKKLFSNKSETHVPVYQIQTKQNKKQITPFLDLDRGEEKRREGCPVRRIHDPRLMLHAYLPI